MASKIVSSIARLFFLGIFFVFLFYPNKFNIVFEYPDSPQSDSAYLRMVKAAFWLLFIIEILRIFYYGVVKSKSKGLLANIATIVIPLLIMLVFLEIVFMYIPQSHEGVLSKSSQIWWAKYWKPVNSLGYRDREVVKENGKKNILFIGDSFLAGHGLKNVNERFSNIIATKLGTDKYSVYNLGMSGADTRDEVRRLKEFPVKPNVIVLQYFPNDIEKVGREKGLTLTGTEPYADLTGPFATIIKRFYLPNFVYWQLPHTTFDTFEKFVQTVYTDTTILNEHLRDVSKITDYRDSTKSEMYAVIIPFLFQMDKSAGYTKPVEDFLRSKGVKVITITEEIARIAEKNRVVGKNDGHASADVNAVIAEKLLNSMKHP